MIDFRYHLVSLIAVFLAVALGIVIGTTQLNGGLLDNLKGQVSALEGDKRTLEAQTKTLRTQADAGAAFGQAVAPVLVKGALAGRAVLVVVADDRVPPETVDGVTTLIGQAGGAVSGTVRLQAKFTDPASASSLQSYVSGPGRPAGITLPETDDTAKLTAALLAGVLMIPGEPGTPAPAPAATSTVLAGLASLGVLTQDGPTTPANHAILLTGGQLQGQDANQRNAALVDLVAALDRAGSGTVVGGDAAATDPGGLLGVIRADRGTSSAVSTVDNIDMPTGRISAVLALVQERAGSSGRYGTSRGTQPVPPLPGLTP